MLVSEHPDSSRSTSASTAPAARTCTTSGVRSVGARRWSTATTPSSATSTRSSGAYRGWREKAEAHEIVRRGASALPSEQLARIGYHVPFCKMAKKAHVQLRRCDLDDVLGAFDEGREEREGATSFERQVAPSLTLCSRVGNVYTGSLYLGLAGCSHAGAAALAGKRIGLFSYGSGCASEFFSGVVGKNAAERIQRATAGRGHRLPGARHGGGVRADDGARPGEPRRSPLRDRRVPLHRRERSPPPVRGWLTGARGSSRGAGEPVRGRASRSRLSRAAPSSGFRREVRRRRVAGAARFWHAHSHLCTRQRHFEPSAAQDRPFVEARRLLVPPTANEVGSCDGSTHR